MSRKRPTRQFSAASDQQPQGRFSLIKAAGTGLLLVLAFPKFNLWMLGAVALLPLLHATAAEPSGWRRFVGGLLAGAIFFAGTCYWIYEVQRQYGDLSVAAAGWVFVMFCGVLALYFAVFCWLGGYLWRVCWGPVALPLLWVGIEYARTYLITGFPWLLLGYALTDIYPLARLSQWTGVYGLSYLLVAIQVSCLWMMVRPGVLSVLHLLAVIAVIGGLSLASGERQFPEDQRAYLVQTNVPQDIAFDERDASSQAPLLQNLRELTVNGVESHPQPPLVIWPEVPVPFYYGVDRFTKPFAESIARQTRSYFLMGFIGFAEEGSPPPPTNSAVLLSPSGEMLSRYDKIHLVPFGEYVPLRQWLTLAEKLTAEVSDFVPGNRRVVNKLPGGTMSTLICYEAIFPDLARRFVRDGAQVLVNISNDGWFGSSGARHQHLLMARMRAIENHRYLLRATNTGITAVIRPDGSLAAQLPPDRPGVLASPWGFESVETFYTRHGDWFAWVASAIALLALLAGWRRARSA